MQRKNQEWTAEEEAALVQLITAGTTAARAAVKMKRSVTAVRSRASQLGMRFITIREQKLLIESKIKTGQLASRAAEPT